MTKIRKRAAVVFVGADGSGRRSRRTIVSHFYRRGSPPQADFTLSRPGSSEWPAGISRVFLPAGFDPAANPPDGAASPKKLSCSRLKSA